MKMTPVRLEERELINFSLLAETDFEATWLGLKNKICAYQEVYDKYRQNIVDRLEDFKSNLSPEVILWLFAKREVQLLLNAWKVLNDLLLKLRVDALALPDDTFLNEDLYNAGLTYKNIYGDKEMTEGLGRYCIITNQDKPLTFCVPKLSSGYVAGDPGIDQDHADQYLFRSRVVTNVDSVVTNYDTCWLKETGYRYYEWGEYIPVSTYCREDWFYAFKQTPTSGYTVARLASEAAFIGVQRAFGQMYLCVAKNTRQDIKVGVGFHNATPEVITLKLKQPGECESFIEHSSYRSQVYYSTEYNEALKTNYQRYDLVEKKYVDLTDINSSSDLQNAMDTYGTVYVNRPVLLIKNASIDNIMDFIYDVIDWRHVDIDKVKCRACGTVGMIDNEEYNKEHCLTCPNCGSTNAYSMEFPKIAYLDFIRPLFQYDPKFSWYDLYVNNKTIHNELDPSKMWRGRFGHGVPSCWTDEVDDLMYKRSLRKSEWDKSAYDLATKVCFFIERYDVGNKIIADEILTLFTEKDQAKALFQVGNIWACRHEIVRILCTQLMKIHQKGVLIK